MNNGLSKTLGMMLLAAAVTAAAGCTAPDSTNPAPAPSAVISASESPISGPLGPPSSEPAAGAAGTPTPADPAAPPPEAPPAEAQAPQAAPAPTFAPVEQQYLASRVPEGTDPNAVLQVGQERCAELEAVKAVDPKAVVSQLVEQRGADVVDAVTGLCPGLQPELEAAARGFTDGQYSIGDAAPKDGGGSIAAGTYEAWNPSPTCQLTAFDAAGGTLAESNGTSIVVIPAGAARVVSDGCYTWLSA